MRLICLDKALIGLIVFEKALICLEKALIRVRQAFHMLWYEASEGSEGSEAAAPCSIFSSRSRRGSLYCESSLSCNRNVRSAIRTGKSSVLSCTAFSRSHPCSDATAEQRGMRECANGDRWQIAAGVSPVPAQMWRDAAPVPAQMRPG